MLVALLTFAAVSGCADGLMTGPAVPTASLALVPVFEVAPPAGAAGIASVRIVVRRLDGSTVADVTQPMQGGSRQVDLDVTVGFTPPSEVFTVEISVLDPNGGLVFHGGPVEVTVGQGSSQEPIEVPVALVVPPPVLQPDEYCSDYYGAATATFEDTTLEAGVRAALDVGAEDALTCSFLSGLTSLTIGIPETIGSLAGAQNLTGLTYLNLNNTQNITDLSPLSRLTGLTALHIRGNSIADLSPLSGMTNLTALNLAENLITDVSPLSGLTNLTFLAINFNEDLSDISALAGLTKLEQSFWIIGDPISDISVVSGFTNLRYLYAQNALITDISALSGLTALEYVGLNGNTDLTDIQPLLSNPGIGAGDNVLLAGTSVDCADVDALRAKGANVSSDCPAPPAILPEVSIVSIAQAGTGAPVNLQAVAGSIDVTVSLNTPPDASNFQLFVLLSGDIAVFQNFAGGGPGGISNVVLTVDTTQYPNGPQSLQAAAEHCEAFQPCDVSLSGLVQLTLAN